ncbi:MAG: Trk system potassium transporter TrkA [Bacillota bacterium]|nr:Trk system potassium transporter TrkA [Bacillota bacterium]MDW7683930.1 Trk system potassium transporter TrkA [Bacillota bacterium]
MRVIIIGGGEVGTELARSLSSDHDVVIIEQNKMVATKLRNEIDCQFILGNGASTAVLEAAAVRKAGLLIAVTETDEVNIISCMLGKRFGVDKTVARLRNSEYTHGKHILHNELMGIDYIINPERVAGEEIAHFILNPGIIESDYYAGGRVHLSGYRVDKGFPFINKKLQNIKMPSGSIICTIIRGDEVILPGGGDVLLEEDEIYVLGKTSNRATLFWGAKKEVSNQRVVIAGGGRVGLQLAQLLEQSPSAPHHIKVIDKDGDHCEEISEELKYTQVYHGDVTDVQFLKNIHINETDIFVAVTGDDEINLLSTMLARKMGAQRTVSEVIRQDYQLILSSIGIDKVVSPRLLTATIIMRLVRTDNIVSMSILRDGKVQLMEAVIAQGSAIDGKRLKDIGFPKGVLFGAVAREEKIIVPDGNQRIYAGDRVVVFMLPEHADRLAGIFSTGKFRNIGSFPALHKFNVGKNL